MSQVLKKKKQTTLPQLTFFCCELDQCVISALSVTELKVKSNEVLGQASVWQKRYLRRSGTDVCVLQERSPCCPYSFLKWQTATG